jgi:hypothetical protein
MHLWAVSMGICTPWGAPLGREIMGKFIYDWWCGFCFIGGFIAFFLDIPYLLFGSLGALALYVFANIFYVVYCKVSGKTINAIEILTEES